MLDGNGTVWTWGANYSGQIGDGTSSQSYVPKPVVSPFIAVAAGSAYSLALKSDGTLWGWGSNSFGELAMSGFERIFSPRQIGTDYKTFAAGCFHATAIRADGSLWAWGDNKYGELGDGTQISSTTPKLIGTGYSRVWAGCYYTFALKSDGSVWAWGNNDNGELGDGTTISSSVPKHVADNVSSIAFGFSATFAIKPDGSLWCWGMDPSTPRGKIPAVIASPVKIGDGYQTVSAGWFGMAAIKVDGSLWVWQRGMQNPQLVGTDFESVSVGHSHALAIKTDGSLWAWGDNSHGQLGDNGGTSGAIVPEKISMVSDQCPQGPLPTELTAIASQQAAAGGQEQASDGIGSPDEIAQISTGYYSAGSDIFSRDFGLLRSWSAFDFERHLYIEASSYLPKEGRSIPVKPGEITRPDKSDGTTVVIRSVEVQPALTREFACLVNLSLQDQQKAQAQPVANEMIQIPNGDSAEWDFLVIDRRRVPVDSRMARRFGELLSRMPGTTQTR